MRRLDEPAFDEAGHCLKVLQVVEVLEVLDRDELVALEQHRDGTGGLATGARTYRRLPKPECGGREITPDIEGRVGLFGKTLEEMQEGWEDRLAGISASLEPLRNMRVPRAEWELEQPERGRRAVHALIAHLREAARTRGHQRDLGAGEEAVSSAA